MANGHNKSGTTPLQVVIIGSGSAAFAAAIKTVENGAQVTMVEAATIGGCCVNVGCVPSKILIRAAHLAQQQRHNPFTGLQDIPPQIDRFRLAQQQTARVNELRQAKYENILETNPGINLIRGFASFLSPELIRVTQADDQVVELKADRVLIATGSKPMLPPINGLKDVPFWTSTEALFAEQLPKDMLVIGSSVIAVELAQAYQRLGTQVTLIARHSLLYQLSADLGSELKKVLENEGMRVLEYTQGTSVHFDNTMFSLKTAAGTLRAEKLLIATGRRPNTAALALDRAGVNVERSGAISIDTALQTNIPGIFAAGDCTNLPQYVYVAAAGGTRAAINMLATQGSEHVHLDLSAMPAVIFSDPQVATVGLSEHRAQAEGTEVEIRRLDLENVPRALANFNPDGFIKIIAEPGTRRILGVEILAENGGEIIQTAVLALRQHLTTRDLANELFPYLTMVEGLKLCAQTFDKDVHQLSCCAG